MAQPPDNAHDGQSFDSADGDSPNDQFNEKADPRENEAGHDTRRLSENG